MSLRRRCLPRGWYPDDPKSLRDLITSWEIQGNGGAMAAVAPHAGWTFSGRLSALAVASLTPAPIAALYLMGNFTLAIFGGHLPSGARPLAAGESSFETPLGTLAADTELLQKLNASLDFGIDDQPDNTVEVLLPIVAILFPGIRILWLRAPNDTSAIDLGEALFKASTALGRTVVCLGSTDLTHYGPNYGFSPQGHGKDAEAWVRDTNDRRFIDALLKMDALEALRRAEAERSACSAGAAAATLAFALSGGATHATLIDYSTSLEVRHDDSFVGYAAISFHKEVP